MKRYNQLKGLLKEAHRLAHAYGCEEIVDLLGQAELSLVMARSSFVAHSVYAGYDRVTVERIAEYVFNPPLSRN